MYCCVAGLVVPEHGIVPWPPFEQPPRFSCAEMEERVESFSHVMHLPIEKSCVQFQRGNAYPEIKHAVAQREEPREAGLELSGNC